MQPKPLTSFPPNNGEAQTRKVSGKPPAIATETGEGGASKTCLAGFNISPLLPSHSLSSLPLSLLPLSILSLSLSLPSLSQGTVTFSTQSMTIFLYCSLSSFKSSTRRLTISAPPTLLAISTVVSTSCRSHMTSCDKLYE